MILIGVNRKISFQRIFEQELSKPVPTSQIPIPEIYCRRKI